ncbi:MAG TPA: hypothetical protein VF929_10375 [Gemmatimonadaceae bacterium]
MSLTYAGVVMLLTVALSAFWTQQDSGTTNELRGLSVVSPSVVWASGTHGTILRTTDGGAHWRADTVPGATALDLRSIAATSATVAHAMSIADSGRVFRTTDGGRSWSVRFTGLRKGSFFDAIKFWDAKHGITVSDPVDGRFLVITTSNGGDTWEETPVEGMPAALTGEGAFAASGSCLVVQGTRDAWFVTGGATVARVFHSGDRGKSWTVSDTPIRAGAASAGIFSADFRDRTHGIIVGGDYQHPELGGRNVALTADGGQHWTLADSAASPQAYESSVSFVPGTKGRTIVAVGLRGTDLSRDGGLTWTRTDSTGYNSVAFASRTAGYAVGPRGRVAKGAILK